MSEPIQIPAKAAQRIDEIIRRRAAIEAELQQAVALMLAAVDAPDGWQIRIEADGSMVAIAPET